MAMNKDTIDIIDAIANHNMQRARMAALAAVTNDTAQSREWWRREVRKKLEAEPFELSEALPSDLRGMLVVEDSSKFPVGRFNLDSTNSEVAHHVRKVRKACDRLAAMGISYANATMLHGEPGVGKTMLARYVAYEQRLPFVYVSFARLVDSYMGATGKNIDRVFSFCESYPCLLMLDEIDTISATRTSAHDGAAKELGRVTVTLMQRLDRLSGSMILMAATNRIDIVDPALRRRFTREFEITRPKDFGEVRSIIETFLDDCGLRYDVGKIERIGSQWSGPCPTQDRIIKALIESIADHELQGLPKEHEVSIGFLPKMMEVAS